MRPAWILRVDDRLVHGQVCVGWGDALGIGHLILADDAIAESDFEQELYGCCLGEGQHLEFWSLEKLSAALQEAPQEPSLVVVSGVEELAALAALGPVPVEVTLGGLHDQPGARQLSDYLFLTPEQETLLRGLIAGGMHITGQPLPSSPRVEIGRLLGPA